MDYFSTRQPDGPRVDLKTAILTGLAPDGGLYLPSAVPKIDPKQIAAWLKNPPSFPVVAQTIAQAWFSADMPAADLCALIERIYTWPVPLRRVGGLHVCELFHGPSCSFKDFAAQFLMQFLDALLIANNEQALILTATSGDTGSAVAAACHGRQHLRAAILYPAGKISPIQEQQIACWGGNVQSISVPGTFDDCQHLVKEALATWTDLPGHLTSANSINVGRLLPQTFYYWYAALHYPGATFVVPSGNFGNLTAGVLAKRMGAPIQDFLAATNANDAVPRYLHSGTYMPRRTIPTLSNAMDVSRPSNFERLCSLYADDVQAMGQEIHGIACHETATRTTIANYDGDYGYLVDPHTAVALWAADQSSGNSRVVLSTADPAKFSELMRDITGRMPPIPQPLEDCRARESRNEILTRCDLRALRTLLLTKAE